MISKTSGWTMCWLAVLALGFAWLGAPGAGAWELPRPYRVEVTAGADGSRRSDFPAKATLDFPELLASAGIGGGLNPASLAVVEVDSLGETLDADVPFQFDHEGSGVGELIFLLGGQTGRYDTRRFHVYFDTGGTYTAPTFAARVNMAGKEEHEGQRSFKIETYEDPGMPASATWYYHIEGGGFASLEDRDGNDWLGYHPYGGSDGRYRGIPNLGHPGNIFHPGVPEGSGEGDSDIVSEGPLRVKIASEATDDGGGAWACEWEVYPEFAQLTVLETPRPYWFLYEGTPGGAIDYSDDFFVLSDGRSWEAGSTVWNSGDNDIPDPEWIYFADPDVGDDGRAIYLVHHEDDSYPDAYWPMQGNMTVFGFGRQDLNKYLTGEDHFTVGLVDQISWDDVEQVVAGAYRPLEIDIGSVETVPEPAMLLLLTVGGLSIGAAGLVKRARRRAGDG